MRAPLSPPDAASGPMEPNGTHPTSDVANGNGHANGSAHNGSDDKEEPLAGALCALFCTRRSTGTRPFLAATDAAIGRCETDLTAAARSGRPRMEASLHGAADAQEAVRAHAQRLEDVLVAMGNTGERVAESADELEEKVRVRRNLDAALALVAHTRKLIRTYARVEDVIAARRLHTALHMLDTVGRSDQNEPDAAALLDYLYPRARRLRGDVASHAERALTAALQRLESMHTAVGERALHNRDWTLETAVEPPQSGLCRTRSLDAGAAASVCNEPVSLNMPHEAALDAHAPVLYLRPLLQAVQIYAGLGNCDVQTEYRRQREKQLRSVLSRVDNASVATVEVALTQVAGLIVVEKCLVSHIGSSLVGEVAVKELWRVAHSKLASTLTLQEKGGTDGAPLFRVHAVQKLLHSFSVAYSLPLQVVN